MRLTIRILTLVCFASWANADDTPIYRLPPRELQPGGMSRTVEAKDPEWNMTLLKVPDAWKTTRGKGVNVAVLDTGIDGNHPDLKTRLTKEKNFTRSQHVSDKAGHGTHCAGVIAASGGHDFQW
jgi:subtilisin family serine protease